MRHRVLAFVVVLSALLLQPAGLHATRFGFDPSQPIYSGLILEDASCPGATHALREVCFNQSRYYLVFKMKGIKHRLNSYQILQGSIDTTTCPLPLIEVRRIHEAIAAPPPCEQP